MSLTNLVRAATVGLALVVAAACGPRECQTSSECDPGEYRSTRPYEDEDDVCSSAGICVDPLEDPQAACGDSPLKGMLVMSIDCDTILYFRKSDCFMAEIKYNYGDSKWRTDLNPGGIPIPSASALEQSSPEDLDDLVDVFIATYGFSSRSDGKTYYLGAYVAACSSADDRFCPSTSRDSVYLQFINRLIEGYNGLVAVFPEQMEDGIFYSGRGDLSSVFFQINDTISKRECHDFLLDAAVELGYGCLVYCPEDYGCSLADANCD